MSDRQLLSVIVPCYNEQEVIRTTHERLTQTLRDGLDDLDYELIYVNDGSRDTTLDLLREIQAGDPNVKVVSFARNFGHQVAVTAGVDFATGDAVVLIDADLQDPPAVILEMVAKWREGYHVAYGQRTDREGESAFKLLTAKAFYRLMNRMSDTAIPLDTGDFRLMDRKVVEALKRMPERDRFIRGMVSWVGFRQTAVKYHREARFAGTSKYPLRKMLRFALDGMLSFSLVPLKLATMTGFIACFLAMLGILYALYMRIFTEVHEPGWTTEVIAIFFLGGVQLISLGIIGEYVGRIYREVKRRPLYLVGEKLGFGQGTGDRGLETGGGGEVENAN
ncbi:MAG: glycosyltransferase [Phycisphaera sp.]|nr:glycosyltransferase [Phycisphaera sp.]